MNNCNKQNEKIELIDEKTLIVGVDIVTIHSQLETITKNTMSLKCFTLRIYRDLSFLLPGSDPLSMHVQSVQNCSLHVYVLSQDNF